MRLMVPRRSDGTAGAERLARLTDAQLLVEAALEPAAFEVVFLRHVSAVHRYLARRVEPVVVEDLVAETFALAFDRRGRYGREYPDARPWLLGIATNLVRHHWRSERVRLGAYARVASDEVVEGADVAAVARADARAVGGELAAALSGLRRGDRDALLLMAWAELSYEEIAQALEIPVGTVRSRINRARRRVRELLDGVEAISEQQRPIHDDSPSRPMNEIDMLRRLGDEIPAPDQPTVDRLHTRLREHIDRRAGAKRSRWFAMRWPKTAPGGLFAVLWALLLSVAAWTPRGLPRRWWSWLRRSNSIALVIGALVISGSAAAGVISLSASSSQPLTGKVPGVIKPASLAGYRYAITVTPNLDAGEAFWNTAITYSNGHGIGTGSGGGSLYATLSNPLFGADTDSFVASWPSVSRRGDTVGYVLSGPQVAGVRLGSHTIRTFSSPELPARDRAAVFFLPAGSPILTSGWRPGEPIRSVMHITPASVGLTPGMPGYRGPANIPTLAVIPLDAHGNAIASHPKMPSSPFPYFWQAPSAITPSNQASPYRGQTHPLPGVCELAQDGLPALRAEWGHAIHELRQSPTRLANCSYPAWTLSTTCTAGR
jgi:RNA polymerase sigma factor (sigma-70 family)